MRILIIGLCSLHKGRMEYGNIGNYYILEPFIRELHRVFPKSEIYTTMQMTKEFCHRENINCIDLKNYYEWSEDDLSIALKEYALASVYNKYGILLEKTSYINEVQKSDLIIDFSGDMWGDNADLAGENRFLVNLLKDKVAQLLGKKTVMLIGSPGPFSTTNLKSFAKDVYKNFDYVTNREPLATKLLEKDNFDLSKTENTVCPSFFFEPIDKDKIKVIVEKEGLDLLKNSSKKLIGFTISGFNMPIGPYTKWPRNDSEYTTYVNIIEKLISKYNYGIVLISHTNGFKTDGSFKLIHGRDYFILEQLYQIIRKRKKVDINKLKLIQNVYLPAETKGIISYFDIFVSGRAHGAVAALSQNIPCILLNYINGPKSHKLKGFASILKMENYVINPENEDIVLNKILDCINKEKYIIETLKHQNKIAYERMHLGFDKLKNVMKDMIKCD